MYLFNRSITVNVHTQDDVNAIVNGIFLDSHHELCLTLTVNLETNEVIGAEAELRRAPHPDCLEVESRVTKLIGLRLVHGVRKKIQAAVGEKDGCTHLTDLALECVKGLVQAKFNIMHRVMSPEVLEEHVWEYLKGSCHHYREN